MDNDWLDGGAARRLRLLAAALAAFAFCLAIFINAPQVPGPNKKRFGSSERVAPFVATPLPVVAQMLKLAQVGRNDVVYDLGSGDGRIVIIAAQKFGARAVGIELDEKLFNESAAHVAALGLEQRVTIIHANMFETDLRPATVVTLFLWEEVNARLRPLLERELRPGARVVSHKYEIPGWKSTKAVNVTTENGVSRPLYLYVRP